MEDPKTDEMYSNYSTLGEEKTTEETRIKRIEADYNG